MSSPPSAYQGNPVRRLGNFELRELVGRSQLIMAWRAHDPRSEREVLMLLPRTRPGDEGLLRLWDANSRRAARLQHPHVAPVAEVGVHAGWPFQIYEMGSLSWPKAAIEGPWTGPAAVGKMATEVSLALAAAHAAGVVHGDLQPFLLIPGEGGRVRVAGWEVATLRLAGTTVGAVDGEALAQRRAGAIEDVLALGIIMHAALRGQPALDEPDVGKVLLRMAPHGRELLTLPPAQISQLPEPLRAITNRATHFQESLRYRSARTLVNALEGWQKAESGEREGLLTLAADRLRSNGLLPSSGDIRDRMQRLVTMEGDSASEMSELIREDIGLGLELIRVVHAEQVRDPRRSGSGPVLTIRRAVAMLGLDGVRRVGLRMTAWPGKLSASEARTLGQVMDRCIQAGCVAQSLRPPGYDAEAVYMVTLIQNLGRLALCCHFPEESIQIHRLTQPVASPEAEGGEVPGMAERAAFFAVLGVDVDALGRVAARYCGFDDATWYRMARITGQDPVPMARSDDDYLRTTASCANDAMDALRLPAPQAASALAAVVHRYGRALKLTSKVLQDALVPNGLRADVAKIWMRRQGVDVPAADDLDFW
jgi:non-specific serine/threonine protein kinase